MSRRRNSTCARGERLARIQRAGLLAWAVAPFAVLAACSGGGTGGGIGSPGFTPPTSPTPTPTPTATSTPAAAFDTAEYRQSDGPSQHNAISAWSRGYSGDGVSIAVIDTGIDTDNSEFAGRISSASKDLFDSRDQLDATDDHGTNVALVAAAARDNSGILGMAWSAEIMALRADTPGSCGSDNPSDATTDCSFPDSTVAQGINYAVANGAKVINISLGGDGGTSSSLRNAVANAVAQGVLIVVAAGNEGMPDLESFGSSVANAGNGGVIVAGSIDANDVISDFSNRAGTHAGVYLAARGERICCVYEGSDIYVDDDNFIYLFSGTSFATPQVAGAAALLAQAFPNLTGRQIAEILFESARDAGDAGDDAVYGQGILDLESAFQPIGTTSVAGTTTALGAGDVTGSGSPAMGDALTGTSLTTLVTDRYDRAFQIELGTGMRAAPVRNRLLGAVESRTRNLALGSDKAAMAFSIDARGDGTPRIGVLELDAHDARRARVLAARLAMQVAPGTALGLAYGESGDPLVAQLQGHDRPAFLIAPDADNAQGLYMRPDASVAMRHDLGGLGLTVSVGSGAVLGAELNDVVARRDGRPEDRFSGTSIALDRSQGPLSLALGLTWLAEERTLLGGSFHDAFGLSGADSLFLDASFGLDLAPGWRVGGKLVEGRTEARDTQLASRAWSLDLERAGVFADSDALALRLSQPLRVESGALNLTLPSDFDYATLTATETVRTLSLAPSGRELIGELGWRGMLMGGNAGASIFYRRDPGHFEQLPDDAGVALRWSKGF